MKTKFIIFSFLTLIFFSFVGIKSNAQYCIPTSDFGCSSDYISNFVTTGAVTNISNASGCGEYTDYSATHSASQIQGLDFNFTATIGGGWSQGLKIWVDWNQDGDFEDVGELVYAPTALSATSFTGLITVPWDALPGTTMMRVRCVYSSTSFTSCSHTGYTDVEDYEFIVLAATPCSEMPLEAGTITGTAICPSMPFSIPNTGTTLASGLVRVWQSSPAGADTWTTIAGATAVNLSVLAGITAPTDYRCILTCTETGESDTTNVVSVTLLSILECYCIPISTSSTYYINNFATTGGISNISNLASGYSAAGYGDFTSMEVSQFPDFSISFNSSYGSSTTYTFGFAIWVDWNLNGVFEAVERMYVSTGYANAHAGTFIVPATALPGGYRMRILSHYNNSAPSDPCPTTGNVEVEDYTLMVVAMPNCEDLTLDAGTLSDNEVCPSVPFVINNVGTTLASGLVRNWQSSPAGADTWTDMGITTINLNIVAGITVPMDYRCILTCTGTGESDTTNVAAITISSFFDCYCIPVSTYEATNHTTLVETTLGVTNFSNTSGVGITGTTYGYSDYTDIHEVSAQQGASFNFLANTIITGSNCYFKIWIDWNQNGIFDGAEEVYSYTVAPGVKVFSGTINVPLTAVPGPTRMRTRSFYSYTDMSLLTACSTIGWGEAEDYTMIVIPALPCSDPTIVFPASTNSIANPENVCETGDVILNIETPMPISLGITYQWQSAPAATGPWTNISGDLATSNFTVIGVAATTYFRCNIKCEGSNQMYSNPIQVESVIPVAPVLFDGQSCGPGPVTLTGTVGSGDIFWFENPTGGVAFASGTEIETPSIDATTTFYAAGGAFPPALVQIGTGTTTVYGAGPYAQGWRRTITQMMYTKDQLIAAGATAGTFDELRFFLANPIFYNFPDYTISIKTVPASSMTTLAWQTTGFTDVFGGVGFTYSPTGTGWQSYPFTPMYWDGESHIIVQTCWSQMDGWTTAGGHQYTTTSGQMLYNQSDAAGTACGLIGTAASSNLPNAIFNFSGCVSERVPVIAYVRDTPVINIDVVDGEYCLFNNTFDIPTSPAQPVGSTFLWNTGDTDSFARVSTDGTPTVFWVEVTNEWGCTSSDSVHLTLKPSPEVDLGPDTLVCEGGVVTLDAGSGMASYYWNTGETTREIVIDDGGSYNVLVTNEFGCMATDEINVTIEGFAPTIDGIIVDNLSSNTFQFTPFHPMHILEYLWTFGDGTATSVSPNPIHTYSSPGTYMVTLEVSSTCGKKEYFTYATIVQSVDEFELSKNNLKLYPNPTNNILNIESVGGVKMSKLTIINMLGQEVLTQDLNKVESYQLDVNRFSNGAYHVVIESDKGKMTKKFQIVK